MNQKKPGKGWLSFLWNFILITGVTAVGIPGVAWVGLPLWGVFVRRPPVNPTSPPGSSSTLERPTDNPSEGNSISLVEGPTPQTRLEDTSEEEGFPVAVQQQKELLAKKWEESLIRSAKLECELEEHVKRGSSEDEISQVLQALTKEQNYRKTQNLEDSLLSQDEIEDLERDHREVKARTIAKARASAARRAKHTRRITSITIRLRRLRASSSRKSALRSNQSPASSDSESFRISAGEEESGHE